MGLRSTRGTPLPRTSVLLLAVVLAAPATPAGADGTVVTVRLGDGVPATDARLLTRETPPREVGRSTPDGRLEPTEPLGEATCLLAPGFVPVLLPPPSGPVEVVLARGATLHGTVTDPDRRPLAGVEIDVLGSELLECLPTARTDAKGRYELTGLPAGMPRAAVSGGAAYPTERSLGRIRGRERRRSDLTVHRAAAVELLVRGAEGRPLAGAQVTVRPEWSLYRLHPEPTAAERKAIEDARLATDEAGRVRWVLPWRDSWRVVVREPSHAPRSLRVPLLPDTAVAEVSLRRGGRLHLRAVDAEGRPWPAPEVRLHGGSADADLLEAIEAGGSDGRLKVDRIPVGRWTVELRAPGARSRVLRAVALRDEATTDLGDVVLAPGASLAGMVEDAAGAPLPGAEVVLAGWVEGRRLKLEQSTDRDGRFAFEGLDPGSRGRLTGSADGFVPARLDRVEVGASDALLTLESAGVLHVVVLDAESGELVPGATVEALPEEGGRPVKGELAGGDAVGDDEAGPPHHRVAPLRAGQWRVRAFAPGHLPSSTGILDVLAEEEPLEVEVVLEAGRRLEGRVLDARDGSAVAGAEVVAEQLGVRAQARSGLDGRFVLDGLADRVELSASHEAYRLARLGETDLARLAQPLEVRLEPGGSLEGTVLGSDGLPAVGAQVRLGSKSTLTDGNGGYLLEGLPPGSRKVSKVDRAGSYDGFEEAWVEIAVGEMTRHDFGVGTRIFGMVTLAGEPAPGAQLTLWESSPRRRSSNELLGASATAGEDGAYVLGGVPFGDSTLVVRWQDRHFSRSVTVPDGAREHRVDVDVPELHLGGVVLDASTRAPIAGATVSAQPQQAGGDARPRMQSVRGGADGEAVFFATFPFSRDQTSADGRFRLLLDAPGPHHLSATAPGYRMVQPDGEPRPLDVEVSRDDVVVEMRGAARVTLKLRDEASGAPVHGGYLGYRTGSASSMTGGSDSATMDSVPSGEPVTLIGWKDGWSPDVRELSLEAGEERTIELLLAGGGSLVLLVPEGTLEMSSWGALQGSVGLLREDGTDLLVVLGQAVGGNATQSAPEQWRLDHLPEGPLTIVVGEGDAARRETVEIAEGLTAEVDLR